MPNTAVNNDLYEQLGDRWYDAYDDPVALLRAEAKLKNPWVASQIEAHCGGRPARILDVGCGGGFLTNYLASQGHHVTGLDISPASLAVARAYDATHRTQYVTGDAYALPFPDQSFQVVTSMDFLEHVESPAQVVREVGRVLKPGGLFIFHTFNRTPLAYLLVIKAVEWLVRNTPPHMHVYRLFVKPAELERHCRASGMGMREWRGIRPNLWKPSVLKGVFTGVVPEDFSFSFCRSLLVGYAGIAVKANKAKDFKHLRPVSPPL